MKKIIFVILFASSFSVFAGSVSVFKTPLIAPGSDASFDLTGVKFSNLLFAYFTQVYKSEYVLCEAALTDERTVSIRAASRKLDSVMMASLLDMYGYEARKVDGVMLVCTKDTSHPINVLADFAPFIYFPNHRDSAYLIDLVGPMLKGTFANKRAHGASLAVGGGISGGSSSVGAAAPVNTASDDYIIFTGPDKEVERLKKLFAQLDIKPLQVMVQAHVYEIGKTDSDGSALSLISSILGGKLGLNVGGVVSGNSVKIHVGGLDAIASAFSNDTRFKAVARPFASLRSGETGRFFVGQEDRVPGAILISSTGSEKQSVEVLSSGVLFNVGVRIHGLTTDVDLTQEVSSFSRDAVGSPVINKREMKTSLSLVDGDVIVIGGLQSIKADGSNTGFSFFPRLGSTKSNSSSELILMLEVNRI